MDYKISSPFYRKEISIKKKDFKEKRKLHERRYFVRFNRWRFAMVFDKISNLIRRRKRR